MDDTSVDLVAAIETPAADAAAEAKLQALQTLQARKVRRLMGSIRKLEAELDSVRASQRPSRQHALLRQARDKLRERDVVVDLLKAEVCSAKEMADDELNAWIVKATTGGPKRFRPKTREELQLEITSLEKKVQKLERKMAAQAKPKRPEVTSSTRETPEGPSDKGASREPRRDPTKKRDTAVDKDGLPTLSMADIDPADLVRERTDMLQRLEDLQVELRTQEGIADSLSKETRELRAENRELRRDNESAKGLRGRFEAMKLRLLEREADVERLGEKLMKTEEDLEVAKVEASEAEAAHRRIVQQLRDELTLAAEELNKMEAREVELENELDRLKTYGFYGWNLLWMHQSAREQPKMHAPRFFKQADDARLATLARCSAEISQQTQDDQQTTRVKLPGRCR
eukprot:scaffold47_cov258-Pinguiococcus_pyrenoidosus.AAC.90